jgi:hypothetical protein
LPRRWKKKLARFSSDGLLLALAAAMSELPPSPSDALAAFLSSGCGVITGPA